MELHSNAFQQQKSTRNVLVLQCIGVQCMLLWDKSWHEPKNMRAHLNHLETDPDTLHNCNNFKKKIQSWFRFAVYLKFGCWDNEGQWPL